MLHIFRQIKFCCVLFGNLIQVFFQLLYGAWKISALPVPIVSIFGGAHLSKQADYFHKALDLSRRFAENDISVLTGGGPGAMEAANCGAFRAKKGNGRTMGIGVIGLEDKNPCVLDTYFELDYFFARKLLLMSYSKAFIFFPGGFGTLDELGELLTLMQTNKIERAPIVLYGTEYWQALIDWVQKETLEHQLIKQEDLELFTITDDLDTIFHLVHDTIKLDD